MALALAIVSLDPWDEVLRRNQHIALRLLASRFVESIVWIDPPRRARRSPFQPHPGVTVFTPPLLVPARLGGRHFTAAWIKPKLRGTDVLWVNDPVLGAVLLERGKTFYDVTDDWRTVPMSPRRSRQLVRSEDQLTAAGPVIVCSDVLAERWQQRYEVSPSVVKNAADVDAIRSAAPLQLDEDGPHVGYVGTLHDERLDIDLVVSTADSVDGGMVHLVGPDHLSEPTRTRLQSHPKVRLHGPVSAAEVPAWLAGLDVLICPHRISAFTMSLDAIKAYEYLATTKPVVATPSSGFQQLVAEGLTVSDDEFVEGVRAAIGDHTRYLRDVPTWDDRAREFEAAIEMGLLRG